MGFPRMGVFMASESGEWIMHGVDWDAPGCIHTVAEAMEYIHKIGFLPLFRNDIPGFSLEEHTASNDWWSGEPKTDPWIWREAIARTGEIAYGKFFDKKAGFISREWFPYFANYRRDGYDFDARWEDGLASVRHKRIMDLFEDQEQLYSYEIKKNAGYGKGGEKNFEGMITALQMQTYLCMKDFKRRRNKRGEEYGWNIAIYSRPEQLWGYDYVTSRYCEEPEASWSRMLEHAEELYPAAEEKQLRKVLK